MGTLLQTCSSPQEGRRMQDGGCLSLHQFNSIQDGQTSIVLWGTLKEWAYPWDLLIKQKRQRGDVTGVRWKLVSRVSHKACTALHQRQSHEDKSIRGLVHAYFSLIFSHTSPPPGPFLLPHNSMRAESACSTPGE